MADRVAGDRMWMERWLDSVAAGASTMSQRKLATIDARGGLKALRKLAKQRGIHLVLLTDDRGVELLAASTHQFKVIC